MTISSIWPLTTKSPEAVTSPCSPPSASPVHSMYQQSWGSPLSRLRSDDRSLSDSSGASGMSAGTRRQTFSASSGSTTASPGITYQERASRLKERIEAREIREAMERLALEKEKDDEERRIFEAAQKEAVELVRKHHSEGLPKYTPTTAYQNPDLRLRRLQRRREPPAIGRESPIRESIEQPSSAIASSDGGKRASMAQSVTARPESRQGTSGRHNEYVRSPAEDRALEEHRALPVSRTRNIDTRLGTPPSSITTSTLPWLRQQHQRQHQHQQQQQRRRSSGRGKRVSSNSSAKGVLGPRETHHAGHDGRHSRVHFKQTADTKYTKPLRSAGDRVLRGNDGDDIIPPHTNTIRSRINRFEVHQSPRTQSTNPLYTQNPPPSIDQPASPERAGLGDSDAKEVRSQEIRAATTMRRADRSPNLPTPTAVSDSSSRPIVSFDKGWEAPEPQSPAAEPAGSATPSVMITPATNIPQVTISEAQSIPTFSVSSDCDGAESPSQRSIHESQRSGGVSPSRPLPSKPVLPPLPTINVSKGNGVTEITVSAPDMQSSPTDRTQRRPLPDPRTSPSRSPDRTDQRRSWRTPYMRTGVPAAACDACSLPIAGRVVTACNCRFHPHCFACYHCQTPLECVAFYQEPESQREERLARSDPRDQDARKQRFYCHLDFHELFSPRCKTCKTPIEGEVIVACGAQYHIGHFFCAECGDPFGPTDPFVEKDGHAWCVNCHSKRTAPRCAGCKQLVLDEMVITALGGNWHSKCFACCECGETIAHDAGFFVREGPPKLTAKGRQIGGPVKKPVCENCEKYRLKGF
ncbi:hypothetical protein KEM52_006651 [Ascosphaera acerosa]|nr:hypothetical protein KEM52_006651 [Ascosphaera acerosa]